MAVGVTLNQTTFESLVKQMVDLEERLPDILDEFFAGGLDARTLQQREEINGLLTNYLKQLDGLVASSEVSDDSAAETVPFVTLGSIVTLHNLGSGQISEVIVVTPYEIDRQAGKISFLSPLGKALLLKRPGDVFEILAPRGTIQYQVISIRY